VQIFPKVDAGDDLGPARFQRGQIETVWFSGHDGAGYAVEGGVWDFEPPPGAAANKYRPRSSAVPARFTVSQSDTSRMSRRAAFVEATGGSDMVCSVRGSAAEWENPNSP
jgi:hypothetical protein